MSLGAGLSKNGFCLGTGPPGGKSPAVGRAVFCSVVIIAGVSRGNNGAMYDSDRLLQTRDK